MIGTTRDFRLDFVFSALAVLAGLALAGCSSAGQYVWVQDLPSEQVSTARDYVIRIGDVVSIQVFQQDAMTKKARVRSDGKIAMPIIGDVDARGKRPADLGKELEVRLKDYVVEPHVTVSVEESQPITISIIGEISKPGLVVLDPSNASVITALASAGGMTDYADKSRIFVIRQGPKPARIRFTYQALSRGEGRAGQFTLQSGDVIVVE